MGSGYVYMYVCSSHCPPNELHAITSMHECTPLECGDTLSTDKDPPTYHLQQQEGNQYDLAHGKRISYVSGSWPALYGTHNPE